MLGRIPWRRVLPWLLLLGVVAVAGCGESAEAYIMDEGERPEAQGASISAEVVAEVEALQRLLSFPRVLFFPTVAFSAWLLSRIQQQVARLVLAVAARPRRRQLATLSALITIGLWIWAFSLMLGRLLRAAPTLTLAAGALAAIVLLVGLSKQVENIAAGIGLAVRSRIDEGDQVTIGSHTGMVRRVGSMRVQLRTSDGDLVYIPNREFVAESVAIGRTRNTYPLVVKQVRDTPWSAEDIDRARLCAVLSPYRDPESRVSVTTEGERSNVLSVEIQVWLPRLLPAAEQHLRRQLAAQIGPREASARP